MDAEFILYQPSPTKQLLYDTAASLSVIVLLKMKGIPNKIKTRPNALEMSENGRLPVVVEKTDDVPMCGFNQVYWRVARKQDYVPRLLELAYMEWVDLNFLEAELYICWCHNQVVQDYTKSRFICDLPWPASTLLFNRRRAQMIDIIGVKYESFDQLLEKFNIFMAHLNSRIKVNRFFFGKEPSGVDALIYGHVNAISSSNLHPKLLNAITMQRKVMNLCQMVQEHYPS